MNFIYSLENDFYGSDLLENDVGELTRHRRDMQDAMRMPGTRWCGRGWTADQFYELVSALKDHPVQ